MKPSKNRYRDESGNVFLHVLLGVVLIVIICLIGWRVYDLRHSNPKSTTVLNTAASAPSTTTTTPSTAATSNTSAPTVNAGTDNSSLNTSLNNINSLLGSQASDSSSLSAALNDSQNEITVPTN